jgi:hypothetical protein
VSETDYDKRRQELDSHLWRDIIGGRCEFGTQGNVTTARFHECVNCDRRALSMVKQSRESAFVASFDFVDAFGDLMCPKPQMVANPSNIETSFNPS